MAGDDSELGAERADPKDAAVSGNGRAHGPGLIEKFLQRIGLAAKSKESNGRSPEKSDAATANHFDILRAEIAKQRHEPRPSLEFSQPEFSDIEELAPPDEGQLPISATEDADYASATELPVMPELYDSPTAKPVQPSIARSKSLPDMHEISNKGEEPIPVELEDPEPAIPEFNHVEPEATKPEPHGVESHDVLESHEPEPQGSQFDEPESNESNELSLETLTPNVQNEFTDETSMRDNAPESQTLEDALADFERKRMEIESALREQDEPGQL